ncbi:VOC family protein [Ruania alba]|uniref:Glyoxalase-like domain-containing protein n=1 Tax=Ruania alba TaxID=648782 RepID=A0A1H5MAE5_9MICO|nr:VOC family protein [Ruania alba]SEE86235.1 hypothetical protein SAMN04488554_3248 [Ruania alba]
MARLDEIVVDCRAAPALARFWAEVLDGYAVRPYDDAEIARLAGLGLTPQTDPTVAVDGPGPTLFFQEVPEPKSGKNRLHLDVTAADRQAEVTRVQVLGARVLAEHPGWTVLADPEGNEFCISSRGG